MVSSTYITGLHLLFWVKKALIDVLLKRTAKAGHGGAGHGGAGL